jgi:hypothetical protein
MSSVRPLVLLLLGLGLAVIVARTGVAAIMPGPAKGPITDSSRLDRNDDCLACHTDVAREWSHSLHRRSFEDPMFQAALARERDGGFCRACHAPEADPRREPTAREASAGVACVSCHLDGKDGVVLAAPDPGADDREVPHALRRTSAFASPDACAGCHEFWFPSGGRAGHELKMQRTITEHERSPFADESCQSCHMPPTRSDARVHHDHGFAVVGRPEMLRAAVSISATRPEPGRVVLELSPNLVGHAFPTGDLFRRLVVELHAVDRMSPGRRSGCSRASSSVSESATGRASRSSAGTSASVSGGARGSSSSSFRSSCRAVGFAGCWCTSARWRPRAARSSTRTSGIARRSPKGCCRPSVLTRRAADGHLHE